MKRPGMSACLLLPALLLAAGCAGTRPLEPSSSLELQRMSVDQIETALNQADADLGAKKLEAALSGFSNVLKTDAANERALVGLAETHLAMGNGELAMKTVESWPAHLSARPHGMQTRGMASLLAGNDEAAQRYLTAAVGADPSLWRAWAALGRVHDRRRDWPQAETAYQRALQVNPQSAELLNDRGYSLLLRGKHAEAEASLQKALQVDPTLEAARNNLTLALALQGRYDTALASIPAENIPVALNNVGFAALVRGDYRSAETYLNRAIETSPRHFEKAAENQRWLAYLRSSSPKLAAGENNAPPSGKPIRLSQKS